jgi:hypothetical protein
MAQMQAMHKTSKTTHVHRQTATLRCTFLPKMHALIFAALHRLLGQLAH